MGRGHRDRDYMYDDENAISEDSSSGGSSESFGTVMFYGERANNETAVWSAGLGLTTTTTPSTNDEDFSPFVFTDRDNQIVDDYTGLAGHKASKLINTAASMAAGVLDSVTPSPQNSYFETEIPTNITSSGYGSDGLSNMLINVSTNSSSILHADMVMPIRDPLYIVIPITVIYVIILIIGLLGNVVTCIVIVRSRYLHTTTNYYLFSLAISDLLLLLSGLPVEMYSMWRRYPYIFGEYFCVGRGLAAETSSNATVLTITAFTIERYLAICRPFMIQKWQNKLTRVVRQIVIIWVISISLAVPQALQFGVVAQEIAPNQTTTFCFPKQPLIEHSFEIATVVFFVAPMILITVLYCLIGLTLRNASNVKESKLRLRKSLSNHKREVGQQRVLKMLVCVVVAFFICWFPFHLQRLIHSFINTNSEAQRLAFFVTTYISGVLYYLSTCINPILYHIMSLKFRHAFQENVNKCCGERYRKKQRREREHLVGAPSISHSSHTRSQGIVLTEITPMTLCNNAAHVNCHHNGSVRTNVKLETKYQGSEV